ncbi:MAG: dTDP-4-dehydrorhamnose 3,5-epimerase family protein [Chloroflexi bacterium]|nr:dTDP-4-dehydrorhamnose 3,5-epimerase family protein [Chloroflexota bacterium]
MTDWPGGERGRLDGVWWGRLASHTDERGAFREIWRASWSESGGDAPNRQRGRGAPTTPTRPDDRFVQANLSSSRARVLRGLHYHRRQLDRWTIANGKAFVALVDVRPVLAAAASHDAAGAASGGVRGRPLAQGRPPEPGPSTLVEARVLGPDEWVVIPSGVAHGFYAIEPTDLLYFVTNEYDGTDELGFAWDDPEVGVPWPDRDPILSLRDRSNPSLRELVRSLR